MFGLFKKPTTRIHELVEIQRRELLETYPAAMARMLLDGEDCDYIANGFGDLGSKTNPIPVNGPIGEIKYLAKLITKSGHHVFFHRLCSLKSPGTIQSIDCYEVVGLDGAQWATLHLDMYHPRRSNLPPPEFTLMPIRDGDELDLPIGFGVNGHLENFPYDIPDALTEFYGGQGVFERKAKEFLSRSRFVRPE